MNFKRFVLKGLEELVPEKHVDQPKQAMVPSSYMKPSANGINGSPDLLLAPLSDQNPKSNHLQSEVHTESQPILTQREMSQDISKFYRSSRLKILLKEISIQPSSAAGLVGLKDDNGKAICRSSRKYYLGQLRQLGMVEVADGVYYINEKGKKFIR